MKPRIDEIEEVFTEDGGTIAWELHQSIIEGLGKNKDTQMLPLVKAVVAPKHQLHSPRFKDWDEVILAKAKKSGKRNLTSSGKRAVTSIVRRSPGRRCSCGSSISTQR